MAVPVIGHGGVLGIGVESTWGTAVARTNWKDMRSMGLRRMITRTPVADLGRHGQASTNHRFDFVESDFCGGPLAFDMCYNDSTLLLLEHLFGAVATTGVGPYTHTFTLATPLPTGLTLEQISGRHASLNQTEVFEGCKVDGGRIIINAGEVARVECDIIGQTSGGLTSEGSPSLNSSPSRILHHQATGLVEWNNTDVAANGITFTIVRNLARNHELGSSNTSEPHEDGGLDVTFEIRTKWQENATDTDYLAGTARQLDIQHTGTGNDEMTITAPNAIITEITREVSSKGAIEKVIRGRCLANASSEGLSLAIINDNSAHDDN